MSRFIKNPTVLPLRRYILTVDLGVDEDSENSMPVVSVGYERIITNAIIRSPNIQLPNEAVDDAILLSGMNISFGAVEILSMNDGYMANRGNLNNDTAIILTEGQTTFPIRNFQKLYGIEISGAGFEILNDRFTIRNIVNGKRLFKIPNSGSDSDILSIVWNTDRTEWDIYDGLGQLKYRGLPGMEDTELPTDPSVVWTNENYDPIGDELGPLPLPVLSIFPITLEMDIFYYDIAV